jgi:Ca2+-transporting ATPase
MAIALAVAAVPEGLPVVATIALAVGVRRMARRRALIRHLPVVETLGSASVICSDKTGTLTTSEMRVTVLRLAEREVTVGGEEGRPVRIGNAAGELSSDPVLGRALEIGVLANAAELPRPDAPGHPVGDPTDVAFLVLGRSAGLERAHLLAAWPEVRHVPFSSERMLMASTHSRGEGLTTFVKGSPQAVLERCDRVLTDKGIAELRPEQREELLASNRELAGRGLRVLGLATKEALRGRGDDLSGLTWVALAGLSDPPAAGVIDTVRGFRDAGIRTVMITGDHRLTAASVGRDLGLLGPDDDILEGRDLDRLSDTELDGIITRVGVFGRVSPESKLRIVAAFQRRGEIVAMLGDGVNDAAALRKADIGVAMGRRGTDLAKEAADVILEDDRFATIGVAIEEGRVIRENIRKFVAYLFSCNLAEILVLLGAGLAGYPGILTPLQILWLNLLTDTFPALALAVEPGEPGIMRKPPPGLRVDILPGTELWSATAYALLIATGTLVAFAWGQRRGDPAAATTLAFMTLALAQVLHLGNARSRGPVLSRRRVLENLAALGAAVLAIALQVLVALSPLFSRVLDVTPLSLPDWLAVLLLAALPAVAGQTVKWLRASRR